MAEEYRSKYLALEREFNYLQQTHALDVESYIQEYTRKESQILDRLAYEKENANRRLETAIAERDSQVDQLIEDNKSLQNRLLEADQIQLQLRHQIKQSNKDSHQVLDQLATVKCEKEEEILEMLTGFRNDKAIL